MGVEQWDDLPSTIVNEEIADLYELVEETLARWFFQDDTLSRED